MESRAVPEGERKYVLVADDDADVCALLRLALEPSCEVDVVHDGETALARLSSPSRIDAIISDFMLPGITGLEFVMQVRRSARRHVPILMISGHGAFNIGAAAKEAGADAFLDKPFTLAQLRSTIGGLLGPGPKRSPAA